MTLIMIISNGFIGASISQMAVDKPLIYRSSFSSSCINTGERRIVRLDELKRLVRLTI